MTPRGLTVVLLLWPRVRWPTLGSRLRQLRHNMRREAIRQGVLPHPRAVH